MEPSNRELLQELFQMPHWGAVLEVVNSRKEGHVKSMMATRQDYEYYIAHSSKYQELEADRYTAHIAMY